MKIRAIYGLFLILFVGNSLMFAQTTAFSYQGKLADAGNPANGNYQLEFKLFDALSGGNQIGESVSDVAVTVTNGVFDTALDFGAGAFTGADRFLEIAVRRNAGESYVVLTPREQIRSTPLAIRSKSAETADDAAQLGGMAASEYPTTASISNAFINNENAPLNKLGGAQTASFNITGNGTLGGTIQANEVVAQTGTGFYGLTQTDGATTISTYIGSSSSGASGAWIGTRSNSPLFFFTNNGQPTVTLTGGNVGINTTTPQSRLAIRTGTFDAYGFTQTNGTVTVGTYVDNNGGAFGTRSNAPLYFFTNSSAPQVTLTQSGDFGIGVTPQAGLKLDVGGVGRFITANGNINLGTPNGETGISIIGSNRADVRFNGTTLTLAAGTGAGVPANTGISVNTSGNVGVGTVNPTTKFEVAGTTKTGTLQITGGSDLAENFEIAGEIKPGMVVAIDPRNPGKLILARGAYNRQAAGIVSGANNLAAGMILPNLTENENSLPVALSGRVWVYADASKNSINAGDLLTTSDTAGYAMKVTKYKRANGAIIGKAMTELKSGTGLVLVLVALQ